MRHVSLISDLGTQDHYLALLKAEVLKAAESVNFIDVSHDIEPHDIQEAAYFMRSMVGNLPSQSIHVVSVYNYYDINPEFVVFEYEDAYFIGPNNGVFSLVFDEIDTAKVFKIEIGSASKFDPFKCIAHAIAALVNGLAPRDIGMPINYFERKLALQPVVTNKEIRATIIYVDQFENVVLNVSENFFELNRQGRTFELFFKHNNPITKIHRQYSDVEVGEVVAFFNISGLMEIAINMGKASSMLGLYKNETIQIYFEDHDS